MLIVRTAPRPVSYLAETLRGLAGMPRDKVVLSDGPCAEGVDVGSEWRLFELPPKTGCRLSGWKALKMAYDAGVEDVVVAEDDLEVCEGGDLVIHSTPIPDGCFLMSFLSPFPPVDFQPKQPGQPRVLIQSAKYFTGAQALKIPRRALKLLVSIDPYQLGLPGGPHLFDDSLAHVARSTSADFATVMPNPIKHVGKVSACDRPGRHFYQPWYVKRDERFPSGDLPVVRGC